MRQQKSESFLENVRRSQLRKQRRSLRNMVDDGRLSPRGRLLACAASFS